MSGNPFTNQRDLFSGTAFVRFKHRGVVALTGADRLSYLDSLVSQDVAGLTPGQSSEALLLDPQGRIERVFSVFDDGVTSWLLVDEEQAAPASAFLDRMTFSKDAAADDVSSRFTRVGFFAGSTAEEEVLAIAARPNQIPVVWEDTWSTVSPGGWQYASAESHPASHWNFREALVENEIIEDLLRNESLTEVAPADWDALRIASWRPRFATEVDATSLPHEYDWLRTAVHLNKGCYRGQETVAKVHNLGHPPRRLTMLYLDGSTNTLPGTGAEVVSEDVVVGHVTSAANHFELGPIALALVKRSTPSDAVLSVVVEDQKIAASQQVIVPADAGRTVDVPRMPRLGAVSREG